MSEIVYVYSGEQRIGTVDLKLCEKLGTGGSSIAELQEFGCGSWEDLYRTPAGLHFVIQRSWDEDYQYQQGQASELAPEQAVAWLLKHNISPPDDMRQEMGLPDLTAGPADGKAGRASMPEQRAEIANDDVLGQGRMRDPYLIQSMGPYTATAWLWSAWIVMAAYGTRHYKDLPERWRLDFEEWVAENVWPNYVSALRNEAKLRGSDLPPTVWSPFCMTAPYAVKLGMPLSDDDRALALGLTSQLLPLVHQLHIAVFRRPSERASQTDTGIEMRQGEPEAGERVQALLIMDAKNGSTVDAPSQAEAGPPPPPAPPPVHPLLTYARENFRSKAWKGLIEILVGGNPVSLDAAKEAASGGSRMTKEALQAVIDRINERLVTVSEVLGATYAIQWKGPTELILRLL